MYDVQETIPVHVDFIAAHLRETDVAECAAFFGSVEPHGFLWQCVDSSDKTYTWLINGIPAAICGVTARQDTDGQTVGVPWMMGTPLLDANPKVILKLSKRFFSEWLREYKTLSNFVPSRSTKTINYLKHLGFVVFPVGKAVATGEDISSFIARY